MLRASLGGNRLDGYDGRPVDWLEEQPEHPIVGLVGHRGQQLGGKGGSVSADQQGRRSAEFAESGVLDSYSRKGLDFRVDYSAICMGSGLA